MTSSRKRKATKLALLQAHPDRAGAGVAADLTAESTAEQASAQLDQCSGGIREFSPERALQKRLVPYPAVRTAPSGNPRYFEPGGQPPGKQFAALKQVHRIALSHQSHFSEEQE